MIAAANAALSAHMTTLVITAYVKTKREQMANVIVMGCRKGVAKMSGKFDLFLVPSSFLHSDHSLN